MNYNDETYYANENNVNDMSYETTNMPPVPNEEEAAAEKGNNGMRALGVAGAIVGSMGIGSAAAWGLYRAFNHQSDTAEAEAADDVVVAEHVPGAQVVTETHIYHQAPPAHVEPQSQEEYVQLIETEVDGQPVIVGLMYDEHGHRVMLIDADHDGQFDIRATDVDNSGDFAHIDNLHTNGEHTISVAQFEHNLEEAGIEPLYSYKNDDNHEQGDMPSNSELELTGIHQITDDEGNVMNVATVRMGERELMLVDPDNTGTFRYAVADANGNGSIDDNEVVPLENPIAMSDVTSLPHSDDYVNNASLDEPGEFGDDIYALDETYDSDDKDVIDAEDDDSAEDSEITDYDDYVNNADEDYSGGVVDAIDEPSDSADVYDVSEDTADAGYEAPETYEAPYDPEPADYEAPDMDYADTSSDDYSSMGGDDFGV